MTKHKRAPRRRSPFARPPGVILYSGPSRIDNEPIVVIATFDSDNEKTGKMIQTWIIRRDLSPLQIGRAHV